MADEKYKVLIVDDSIMDLQLAVGLLKQHYQVIAATGGEKALGIISEQKPDVVLLDVNMPDMNGYEVCRKIRLHDKLIKIIFVSANDSTKEVLQGYDVGGNDYIVKPFNPDVLLFKVDQSIKRSQEIAQITQEARGLAMEAMTSLGEMGAVLTFLKSSFRAGNLDTLGSLILGFLSRFNLNACIQLRTDMGKKSFSNEGEVTPIEDELLTRIAKMGGRFAESGQRMFINYDHASLIIKNMPTDDEFKMGRMRDNLAIMLEGADEKLGLLSLEEETQVALTFIQLVHQRVESENKAFVNKTIAQVNIELERLGATKEQSQAVETVIAANQKEFAVNFNDTRLVEEQVGNILQKIQERREMEAPSMNAGSIDFL